MTRARRETLGRGVVLLAALLACPSTAWAAPLPSTPPAHRHRAGPAADVVEEINRHRARAGCSPVHLLDSLSRAAREHSAEMARRERLTHTGADGSRPIDRVRDAGYRPRMAGEVIASGARTPNAAVDLWVDSPSHRTVVLNCAYTHAGVGVVDGSGGPWWTLDLAAGD
ncbi:CAP domain-containing protein [Streptomyces sp. NPDC058308]|uniref:CAP domain-containing protein n=1 Tax=Streptomyces sp. NPDC058308 TaxID=3346440 RepID=UPI0036E3E124